MKRPIIYLSCLLLLGGFSSCYKDNSTGVTRALSTITLAEGATALPENDTVRYGTNLTLTAPDLQQANETLPLSYRWEVYAPSNATIGGTRRLIATYTDRTMTHPMNLYGTYDIILHASNADNSYIQRMRIEVPNSYTQGLYALLNKSGSPEIAYIPASGYDNSQDAVTYEEGLQMNNPPSATFTGFDGAPSSFSVFPYYGDRLISLTTNTGRAYILDAKTMQVSGADNVVADAGEAVIIADPVATSMRGLIRNGQFYSYNHSAQVYNRQLRGQYRVAEQYPGTYFSSQGAIVTTVNGDAAVLYDQTFGVLYFMRTTAFVRYEISSSTLQSSANYAKWQNRSLTAMTSYDTRQQVALLMQSTSSSSDFILVRFSFVGGTRTAPASFAGLIDVPASLGLNANSRMASHRDLIYLSASNQVYTYVAGSTNFSSSPLLTLPAGQEIVQILPRTEGENTYLYVATTDGTTSSIYYYDVTSGTQGVQLWAKTNITGQILDINYRNQ